MSDVKRDMNVMAKVGEITVAVHREKEPVLDKTAGYFDLNTLQKKSKVHEKALKGQAKSHSTQ